MQRDLPPPRKATWLQRRQDGRDRQDRQGTMRRPQEKIRQG